LPNTLMATVHPTAIVDPAAHLEADVVVGPYCVVGPNVRIGAGTVLHNHVTVQRDTEIGQRCAIYPGAFVGGDPQDLKYHGERTWLTIGDRTTIREMVTIHRGTGNGGGVTRVGCDCLIMGTVHVAHDCWIGNEVIIANAAMIAGHTRIEDAANIGGGAGLHHYCSVGTCAMVAAMARVPKDIPPYMLVEGSPPKPYKVNDVLLKRRGVAEAHIEALKDAFNRLYRSNGAPMARKLSALRSEYAAVPEITRLCDALVASAEGVHGRALEANRTDDKRSRGPRSPLPAPVVTKHAGLAVAASAGTGAPAVNG